MKTAGCKPQFADTIKTPTRKVSATVVGFTLITTWYAKVTTTTAAAVAA
jgi:hypothetical protein